MEPVREACLFLHRKSKSNASLEYQRNLAYSISHFLTYCLNSFPAIEWQRATATDLARYRDVMLATISAKTGETLSEETVALRVRAVVAFFEDGITAGWNRTALDLKRVRAITPGEIDSPLPDPEPIDNSVANYAPGIGHCSTRIRPLDPASLNRLLLELGPAPDFEADESLRDRLVSEWMNFTGVRIAEVLGEDRVVRRKKQPPGLTIHMINSLAADPDRPLDHCALSIVGKFSKIRTIAVPNWLVVRTQHYIQTERYQLACATSSKSHALFLNSAGFRLTIRRYQKIFSKACRRAGLTKLILRRHEDGTSQLVDAVCHSPHDLRHTYAISTYFALVLQGDLEPWKLIQAQLGHKYLSTTVDTYLAWVSAHSGWRKGLRRATSVRQRAGLEMTP